MVYIYSDVNIEIKPFGITSIELSRLSKTITYSNKPNKHYMPTPHMKTKVTDKAYTIYTNKHPVIIITISNNLLNLMEKHTLTMLCNYLPSFMLPHRNVYPYIYMCIYLFIAGTCFWLWLHRLLWVNLAETCEPWVHVTCFLVQRVSNIIIDWR